MPRLPELTLETAPPAIWKMMEAHQAMFGMVLNSIKLMGYCPRSLKGKRRWHRAEPAGRLLL
jgi:hypothetical protein